MRFSILIVVFFLSLNAAGQSRQTIERFEEAVQRSKLGQHEAALINFEKVLDLAAKEKAQDRFLAKIHYDLGVSRFHLGRLAAAAADFETALRLAGGKYEKASYSLGLARSDLGDLAGAEQAFLDTIATRRKNGEAWFDLAFVYLRRNDLTQAQRSFANALRFGTIDRSTAHNNLGVLLALTGDLRTAERHFMNAIRIGALSEAILNLEKCRKITENNGALIAGSAFDITWYRSKKI